MQRFCGGQVGSCSRGVGIEKGKVMSSWSPLASLAPHSQVCVEPKSASAAVTPPEPKTRPLLVGWEYGGVVVWPYVDASIIHISLLYYMMCVCIYIIIYIMIITYYVYIYIFKGCRPLPPTPEEVMLRRSCRERVMEEI